MKVALYARVSTDDKGQDLENQFRILRDWAKSRNFEVFKEYSDMVSGANSNRPQFIEMRMAARQNLFNGILVWSMDRFSREGISQTLAYIEDLGRYKVFLMSYQESWLNTQDEGIGRLLLSIMAWAASFERQRIAERIKAGIAKQKAIGVYRGGRPRKHENSNTN